MVRRPLVATIVTTTAGALLGAALGALVGRVIALFGDETVQVSVPMVFCGTLGYFVGGASAAKGSLDRFGARRSGLGSFVALVLLVVVVGGASVSHTAGAVIFALGIVAAAVAAVGATLVSSPQSAPVPRGGLPRAVAPPVKQAEAEPQEQVEAEYLEDPGPTRRKSAVATKPAVRKVPVASQEPEPAPETAGAESANWTLSDDAPPARPKRERPLRRAEAAAEAEIAPEITPPPAPRQRRDRPLKKGDS